MFTTGRGILFSIISFLSLIWIILLCVTAFAWWGIIGNPERSFIIVMIVTNVATVIGLPLLIILEFRPYLDVARILLLLVAHIGTALTFTLWAPSFTCDTTADQPTCITINICILSFSWVVPTLLILYAGALALHCQTRRRAEAAAHVGKIDTYASSVAEKDVERADVHPAARPEWDSLQRGPAAAARMSASSARAPPPRPLYTSWLSPPPLPPLPASPRSPRAFATPDTHVPASAKQDTERAAPAPANFDPAARPEWARLPPAPMPPAPAHMAARASVARAPPPRPLHTSWLAPPSLPGAPRSPASPHSPASLWSQASAQPPARAPCGPALRVSTVPHALTPMPPRTPGLPPSPRTPRAPGMPQLLRTQRGPGLPASPRTPLARSARASPALNPAPAADRSRLSQLVLQAAGARAQAADAASTASSTSGGASGGSSPTDDGRRKLIKSLSTRTGVM